MKQCTTMAEARRNIDRIDRRIGERIHRSIMDAFIAFEARECDRSHGASASA